MKANERDSRTEQERFIDRMLKEILGGQRNPGDRLPTESELAAQYDLRKTNDFDAQWAKGDMEPLKAALKERVWQWGSMKEPQWIVESLCGGKFDPHHFTEYLKKKYTELYNL